MARTRQICLPRQGSQVPMFVMARSKTSKYDVVVTCTRCGGTFSVNGKIWARSIDGNTRPCPYCFKVSYIRKSA